MKTMNYNKFSEWVNKAYTILNNAGSKNEIMNYGKP